MFNCCLRLRFYKHFRNFSILIVWCIKHFNLSHMQRLTCLIQCWILPWMILHSLGLYFCLFSWLTANIFRSMTTNFKSRPCLVHVTETNRGRLQNHNERQEQLSLKTLIKTGTFNSNRNQMMICKTILVHCSWTGLVLRTSNEWSRGMDPILASGEGIRDLVGEHLPSW